MAVNLPDAQSISATANRLILSIQYRDSFGPTYPLYLDEEINKVLLSLNEQVKKFVVLPEEKKERKKRVFSEEHMKWMRFHGEVLGKLKKFTKGTKEYEIARADYENWLKANPSPKKAKLAATQVELPKPAETEKKKASKSKKQPRPMI